MPKYISCECSTTGGDEGLCPCAYYKCEESSGNLIDIINGYDLTESDTVLSVAGKIERGRGYRTSFPTHTRNSSETCFDMQMGGTVTGWVKVVTGASALDDPEPIWYLNNTTQLFNLWHLNASFLGGTNTFQLNVWDITDTVHTVNSADGLSLNTWYFIAMWVDVSDVDSEIKFRIDGTVYTGGLGGSSPKPHIAGEESISVAPIDIHEYDIDEWAFFDRILTTAQLDLLYNNGEGIRPSECLS